MNDTSPNMSYKPDMKNETMDLFLAPKTNEYRMEDEANKNTQEPVNVASGRPAKIKFDTSDLETVRKEVDKDLAMADDWNDGKKGQKGLKGSWRK